MARLLALISIALSITVAIPWSFPDPSFGQSGYERYVGMHPLQILDEDMSIREKCKATLGDDYDVFVHNLELSGAARLQDDCLFSYGMARKSNGNDSAIFCVDVRSARFYAAILSNGRMVHFYGANSLSGLPEIVCEWALHHALKADPFYHRRNQAIGRL